MAVSNTPRKQTFSPTGVGGVGPYTFNFKVLSASDISIRVLEDDVLSEPLDPSDYTLTLTNGGVNGGSFTLDTGITGDDKVQIEGTLTLTQPTPYANLGAFNPERHEASFDRLTIKAQELDRDLTVSIKIPSVDTTGTAVTMPVAALRANKAIVFDASGNVGVSDDDYTDQLADVTAQALLASQWASLTSGIVAATDYSAKAWAIGGTGVTSTASRGASKEWAITTGATVDGTDYGAKEHAVGTTVTTGSSKDWATKTSAAVTAGNYSSKEWATGTQTRGAASGGSAKDWATYTGGTVDNTERSAKYYAGLTAADAVSTAADVVSTGADVIAANAAAAAAASSAAEGLYNEVITIAFADSPYVPSVAQEGTLFRCDTSGGNIVVNLSTLATYGEDMKFAFVKTTGDANTITVNRGGSNTIDAGTSKVLDTQFVVTVLVGDSATGAWISCVQSQSIADDSVTFAKMQEITTDRLIGRDTAGTGNPEELTVSGGVEFTGSGGIQRSALTGNVTASAGSNSTTIAPGVVTEAMQVLADNTTQNFSTAKHGYVPKGTNVGNFLKDDGTWASIPSSSGGATSTSSATDITLTNSSNRYQNVTMTAAGKYVILPDATTLTSAGGPVYFVENEGTIRFSVKGSTGIPVAIVDPGQRVLLVCDSIASADGVWQAGKIGYGNAVAVDAATTDLTTLSTETIDVGSNRNGMAIVPLTSTTALICYARTSDSQVRTGVVSISGDTVSIGTLATVEAAAVVGEAIDAVALSSTKVMVAYRRSAATASLKACIVDISGTTATPATAAVVDTTSTPQYPKLCALSATKVLCYFYRSGATDAMSIILDVSTSTITPATAVALNASTANGNAAAVVALSSTKGLAIYGKTTAHMEARVCDVSGSTITPGTAKEVLLFNTSGAALATGTAFRDICAVALSSTKVMVAVADTSGNLYLGVLTEGSSLVTNRKLVKAYAGARVGTMLLTPLSGVANAALLSWCGTDVNYYTAVVKAETSAGFVSFPNDPSRIVTSRNTNDELNEAEAPQNYGFASLSRGRAIEVRTPSDPTNSNNFTIQGAAVNIIY